MRRFLFILVGFLVAVAALGAFGWWVVAPTWIRSTLASMAAARGYLLEVEDVVVLGDGVRLRAVSVAAREESDGETRAQLTEVEVSGAPLDLLRFGRSAVGEIAVRGGTITTRVATGAGAPGGRTGASSNLPPIRGSDLRVVVEVPGSASATLDGVSFQLPSSRRLELTSEAIHVAMAGELRGEAAATEIALSREADGWQIRSMRADRPILRLPEHSTLVDAVLRDAAPPTGSQEPPSDAPRARVASLLRRVPVGGRLEAVDGQVFIDDSRRATLSALSVVAERRAERHWAVEGSAEGLDDATLRFEVALRGATPSGTVRFRALPFEVLRPFLPALPWYREERTRLDGDLTVQPRDEGDVLATGRLDVHDLGLSSPRLAPRPLAALEVGLEGSALWSFDDRRLQLRSLRAHLGDVQATLTGRLEWPETHYLVDLWAELPVTECNTVLSSVPPALLGSNASFSFGGRVRARSVLRIDSRNVESTRFDVALANGCRFESVPALADLTRFRRPFLHRVRDGGRVVFEMTTGPGTARWTPLRDVSPFIVQAVLGHEDGAFFRHGGIDVAALRRALTRNLEAGRFVYGGSTITMQLVKNLFLDREKTVARKLQELLLTWWIETAMTKAEILELYLNVIEYGPRLFGIGPATLYYFGRPASEVTAAEAAYLATILPNPGRFHRETIRDGALTPRWARRTRRFVRRLGQVNRFDDVATADALEQLEDFRFGGVPGAAGAPERPARGGVRRLPLEGMSVWEDPEAAAEEAAEVREEEEAWTWP